MVSDSNAQSADPRAEFEQDVADRLHWLRVNEEAKKRHQRDRAGSPPPLDIIGLGEDLKGDEDPAFRVADLIPPQGDTLIVAQRKTGKTTLITNLARCLKTGEQFLGRLAVRPIGGRVGILNYELPRGRMRHWCREAGCPDDGVLLVNLRGRRNPLDHEEDREVLAARLRERHVEALIVDPFANASRGVESNNNSEVSQWLGKLEEFARSQVGVFDLIVTVHAGWVNPTRSRGASALEDWPDSIINLRADDKTKQRYLKAFGRDVHLDEELLDYNPATRWLTLSGNGDQSAAQTSEERHQRKITALAAIVVHFVSAKPSMSDKELRDGLRDYAEANNLICPGHSDPDVTEAIRKAKDDRRIWIKRGGSGKRNLHFPGPPPADGGGGC